MDACASQGAPSQLVYAVTYTVGNNNMEKAKVTPGNAQVTQGSTPGKTPGNTPGKDKCPRL